MLYYICTVVVASVTTVCVMKIIRDFFRNEANKKVTSRQRWFKRIHKLYWTKKMLDGTIEFWAHSCKSEETWYLGKYDGNKITECDGFYHYNLPWDVQKSALMLFEQFTDVYENTQ